MPWTYRIVDHGNLFALHRVRVTGDGLPVDWVRRAIDFACDLDCGPEGVIASLEEALTEARQHPVMRKVCDQLAQTD